MYGKVAVIPGGAMGMGYGSAKVISALSDIESLPFKNFAVITHQEE